MNVPQYVSEIEGALDKTVNEEQLSQFQPAIMGYCIT